MLTKQRITKKYILLYAVAICFIFGCTYLPLLMRQNMYVYLDIGADTYCSYWPSLAYVQNWLKHITTWDMGLGLGAPVITQICYFLIDPFNWVIMLFSPKQMYIGIFISLVLKCIVLAIIAYLYIRKMKISNDPIICTISASIIVFSGWFVGWGQHYNFATMYVFFVALLLFFERWLQDRKWLGFVFVLAYSCMLTAYYSYMMLLFFSVYYIFRYFCINGRTNIKLFLLEGFRTAGICFLGIGCSGVLFLPAAEEILNSPRVGGTLALSLDISSTTEFRSFILRLFSNNILGINENFIGYKNYYEAPFMYMGILGVLIIPLLFYKQNRKLIYCIVAALCAIAVFFAPTTALFFNAFSSRTYRWTFIFVPVMALGTGLALEKVKVNHDINRKIITATFGVLFLGIIGYTNYLVKKEILSSKKILYIIIFTLVILALYYIFLTLGVKNKYKIIYILVLIELSFNAYYSVNCRSLIPVNEVANMNYFDGTGNVVDYLHERDNGFYRLSKRYAYVDLNDYMIQHYSGEKYYCSTLSSSYWNIQDMFDLRDKNSNYFKGFDDKQFLRNLTCGKYMISTANKDFYGYDLIADFDGLYLYINNNVLDFGVLYECYINTSDYNDLPAYKKGDMVYQACIVEDEKEIEGITEIKDTDLFEISEIGYSYGFFEDYMDITLDQPNKNPILVEITGSDFQGQIRGGLYNIIGENSSDMNDYITIELGANMTKYYLVDALNVNKLQINISPKNIAGVHLYEKNMMPIEKKLVNIKEKKFNIVEFSDSYIHGEVHVNDGNKLLFVPIIYDENWKAYINGVEQKVITANGGFMAVVVPNGDNDIVFRYEAKSYTYGIALTVCSILLIFIILSRELVHHIYRRHSNAEMRLPANGNHV